MEGIYFYTFIFLVTIIFCNNTYSTSAPNTKRMHANIHASMAVSPSALGVLVVTLLKILTSTRKRVTRRAILPGITSIGMRNDIQDTITNNPKVNMILDQHLSKFDRINLSQYLVSYSYRVSQKNTAVAFMLVYCLTFHI